MSSYPKHNHQSPFELSQANISLAGSSSAALHTLQDGTVLQSSLAFQGTRRAFGTGCSKRTLCLLVLPEHHTPTRLTPSCSSPAPSGSPRMISMSTCHMISSYPPSRSLDPNKVLHPGTSDRTFTSGKALVYIHVCATLQSNGSTYPIPRFPRG
jgi:hypothetical protein